MLIVISLYRLCVLVFAINKPQVELVLHNFIVTCSISVFRDIFFRKNTISKQMNLLLKKNIPPTGRGSNGYSESLPEPCQNNLFWLTCEHTTITYTTLKYFQFVPVLSANVNPENSAISF